MKVITSIGSKISWLSILVLKSKFLRYVCLQLIEGKIAIDKFDIRILSWFLPWSVSQSVTHSVHNFLPNERENNLVSSVCGSVEIKYSSQIRDFNK